MNTFSMSAWILQSITLFLAILAAVPLLRAILGLTLVAISETLKLKNPFVKRIGIKMMPAFLRATLGLGLAIGAASPALADEPDPQIVVIDRVIDFEVEEVVSEPTAQPKETVQIASIKPKNVEQKTSYVIKSGDSLWSIAQEQVVGRDGTVNEIDKAWREIWRANRDVIGDNPSLIRPGVEIVLNDVSK